MDNLVALLQSNTLAKQSGQVEIQGDLGFRGALSVIALDNPSAPTLSYSGTPDITTWYVKLVDIVNGMKTAASSAASVANCSTSLSASNYITVTRAVNPGCTSWEVWLSLDNVTYVKITTISTGAQTTYTIVTSSGDSGTPQATNETGNVVYTSGQAARSGKTATDTLLFQAYDVDGAAWTTFGTLTSANTPSFKLSNITMEGTWLASGTVTLPAVTLGGAITGGAQDITNTGNITPNATGTLDLGSSSLSWAIVYANLFYAYYTYAYRGTVARHYVSGDDWLLGTKNVTVYQDRLSISGGVATAVVTWSTCTHTGITLSGALDANGQAITSANSITLSASAKINPVSGVSGFSVVATALTLGAAGSIIAPSCDMGNAANDAARDTLAGNLNGAVAIDSVGVGGVFKIWCRVDGAWKSATIA